MNEAIPPQINESIPPIINPHILEIHRLNDIIKHMYSQQEMDEVLAIQTTLEEEISKLKFESYNV